MVAKKSKATVLAGALALAQQALTNEDVRRRLAAAPRSVFQWANRRRAERHTGDAARFDPAARFGHKGLERRVESIARTLALAFPNADDPGRDELTQAIVRLGHTFRF